MVVYLPVWIVPGGSGEVADEGVTLTVPELIFEITGEGVEPLVCLHLDGMVARVAGMEGGSFEHPRFEAAVAIGVEQDGRRDFANATGAVGDPGESNRAVAVRGDKPAGTCAEFEGIGIAACQRGDKWGIFPALFANGEERQAALHDKQRSAVVLFAGDGHVPLPTEVVAEPLFRGTATDEAVARFLRFHFDGADERSTRTRSSGGEQIEPRDPFVGVAADEGADPCIVFGNQEGVTGLEQPFYGGGAADGIEGGRER